MKHIKITTLFTLLVLVLAAGQSPMAWAQEANLRLVRVIHDIDDILGDKVYENNKDVELRGVAFPPGANTLLDLDLTLPDLDAPEVVLVDEQGLQTGLEVFDPINLAVDAHTTGPQGNGIVAFFVLNAATNELSSARRAMFGFLNRNTIQTVDVSTILDLQNPQGMTINPNSSVFYILNAPSDGEPYILRTDLGPGRNINSINAGADVERIELTGLGVGLRGLAFDPTKGHLLVINPGTQQLHEVTDAGELVATFGFPGDKIDLQGAAIAPSLDQTDNPAVQHLFTASPTAVTEWSFTAPRQLEASLGASSLENGR